MGKLNYREILAWDQVAAEDFFPVADVSENGEVVAVTKAALVEALTPPPVTEAPMMTAEEVVAGTEPATRRVSPAVLAAVISTAVQSALDALVAAAPGALDTLDELAAALGDDPNFATTVINALSAKASVALAQTWGATQTIGSGNALKVNGSVTDEANYVRGALSADSAKVVLAAERAGSGSANVDIALTPAGAGMVSVPSGTMISGGTTNPARLKLTQGFGGSSGIGFLPYNSTAPKLNFFTDAAGPQYLNFSIGSWLGFCNNNSAAVAFPDAILGRGGAATFQLGTLHATTPIAQRIQAHGVTTGTGASLTLGGGAGNVAKGAVILDGGNRGAYAASPTAEQIRDILVAHGLMAAS